MLEGGSGSLDFVALAHTWHLITVLFLCSRPAPILARCEKRDSQATLKKMGLRVGIPQFEAVAGQPRMIDRNINESARLKCETHMVEIGGYNREPPVRISWFSIIEILSDPDETQLNRCTIERKCAYSESAAVLLSLRLDRILYAGDLPALFAIA